MTRFAMFCALMFGLAACETGPTQPRSLNSDLHSDFDIDGNSRDDD